MISDTMEISIPYVITETDLSLEPGMVLHAPIRIFSLGSFGVSVEALKKDLGHTYETLQWDYYDVRRQQLAVLEEIYSGEGEKLKPHLESFYKGVTTLDDVEKYFGKMNADQYQRISRITPFRKRAFTKFVLRFNENSEYEMIKVPVEEFKQDTDDYRAWSRKFRELDDEVVNNPMFISLLNGIVRIILEVEPGLRAIEIGVHQVSIIAREKEPVTNSPEGIHQDGSKYIVSALVIEKRNITGGVSNIYLDDKGENKILSFELSEGEGLFQIDQGSVLWHDISPIYINNTENGGGCRNILGFDINIIK